MKKILKVFKSKTSSKGSSSASTPATETPVQPAPTTTTTAAAAAPKPAPAAAPAPETVAMAPVSTAEFIKAISYRRTVYPLSDKIEVSDDRIVEIVEQVLAVAPSSYNTQPLRVSIFLGEHHKKFWQIIRDEALPLLQGAGEAVVTAMTQRFDMFQAAYGSIAFWEDADTIKQSQETHKSAAGMFPQWGEHANGMLQFQVWTAIELEGLGANLQHMNMFPPAEAALKKAFEIPESWSLKAHLNVGSELAPHPEIPEKLPFTQTLKVFKS